MRYCLSARWQTIPYLKKASEIVVEYRDRNFIYDIVEANPTAVIDLYIPRSEDIVNFESLKQYKTICRAGFRIMADTFNMLYDAKQYGFEFFSSKPIYDGYHLFSMIDFGVCAVRIAGQLTHQLDMIKKNTDVEIRVIANVADVYRPMITGWFRPEDLLKLPQIDVCEFDFRDAREEQALYRIYAEKKEWLGRLSEIIHNIEDTQVINRLIPPEFTERRANCRMSCMNGGECHYCERVAKFANEKFVEKIAFETKDGEE